MGWVDAVVEAYKESEAPPVFFYWSALSAISAVIKKQVNLDRFIYKLYPNIYVFLVARSGMKKSIPVTMARTLVTKANATRIVAGRNSMPRILKDLGQACSLEGGGIIRDAQAYIVSGELAAFLVKDPDALTILTDLHDTQAYEKEWVNSLKGTGVDKLRAPCITLLGATNEEHFADAVPPNAIGGGFIARTFIVFSNEKGKLNSLTRRPTSVPNTDHLSLYLKEIAKCKGEFVWGIGAQDCYDAWYYPFMKADVADPTGTHNRIGDQILKVATLLSLSESPDLILKETHIIEAITVCTECVNGMKQVTMGSGKSTLAAQTKIVMRALLKAPNNCLSRGDILVSEWGNFDMFDLDRIAATLEAANAITITPNGKDMYYTLKPEIVKMYQQTIRSIQ